MGRLLAETTWDCSTLRGKKTLRILAVTLGFALVGPPLAAAQAEPQSLEVAPMPRVVKPKKYKDVTITTSSGARIYRYEEVAPDKFKLVGVFAPDDSRKATGRATLPK
jgi:hypothetical protein